MPELFIEADDYAYIKACVKEASFREVGGLAIVEANEAGGIVRHNRLLKQEVSSGEVEWDPEAHADYLEWLYTPVDQGGAGFTGESYGLYSWHSHGNMGTFWSNTDEDFIQKVGLSVPWIFSSVFNNKGESRHRLDVFQGVSAVCPLLAGHNRIYWDKADLIVLARDESEPFLKELEDCEAVYKETIDKLDADLKALRSERDKTLKEIRERLTQAEKGFHSDIEDKVKADFKEYVKTSSWTSTSHGNPTSGSHKNSHTTSGGGSKSGSNGSSGKKKGGHQGNGSAPATGSGNGHQDVITEAELIAELGGNFRESLWVRCYDKDRMCVITYQLKDVIKDMDLIPLEEIDELIMGQLREDEIAMLANRDMLSDDARTELTQLSAATTEELYGGGWY